MSLKANLQEIYHAASSCQDSTLPLVANLWGTRIYDSRKGWGRLWSLLLSKDRQAKTLQKATLLTHQLFQKKYDEVIPHLTTYREYIEKSLRGEPLQEDHYFLARKKITEWNETTAPFTKLVTSNNSQALSSMILATFGESLPFSSPEMEEMRGLQKIIDFEGWSGGPLPWVILKKLAEKAPLAKPEKNLFKKWAHKINRSNLQSSGFEKAMMIIAKKLNCTSEQSIAELKYHFTREGCLIQDKPEKQQLRWIEDILSGKKQIMYGDSLIEIDQEHKFSSMEEVRVFSLKNHPEKMVIFPQNRTKLTELKRKRGNAHLNYFGLPVIDYISPNGRFGIMEKVRYLKDYPWHSSIDHFDAADEDLAKKIGTLIYLKFEVAKSLSRNIRSSNKRKIPSSIRYDTLLVNDKLQFRVLENREELKVMHFHEMEDFFMKCARGNKKAFKIIKTSSHQPDEGEALYFQCVVSAAIFNSSTDLSDSAGYLEGFEDEEKLFIASKNVFFQTIEIQKRVMQKAKEQWQKPEREIKKIVNKKMWEIYEDSNACSLLVPSYEADVISALGLQ